MEKNPSEDKTPPNSETNKPPIGIFDQFGRKLLVSRSHWFENYLKPSIKENWNNPNKLSLLLASALEQQYAEEIDAASLHLTNIDPDHLRSTCIRSATLLQENRADDAIKTLQQHLKNEGAHPHTLTLLSKAFLKQNKIPEANLAAKKALTLNPNHHEALKITLQTCQKNQTFSLLETLSQNPKAIQAKIELAEQNLTQNQHEKSLLLLQEASQTDNITEEELAHIGNLLNRHAFFLETLQLLDSKFNPKKHGLLLGKPLIEALLELGQTEPAKELLETLHHKKLPSWNEPLQLLEQEITNALIDDSTIEVENIEIEQICIDGPIWIHNDPSLQELLPAKNPDGLTIALLPASALSNTENLTTRKEPANTTGRLSRMLPLLLSEWAETQSDTSTQTFIPWVKNQSAFALFQKPWKPEDASLWTRENPNQKEKSNEYTILIDLQETPKEWKLKLRAVNTLTYRTEKEISTTLRLEYLKLDLQALQTLFLTLLKNLGANISTPTEIYNPPEEPLQFIHYALKLEQCLAATCATYNPHPTEPSISGEREILQGCLLLCLENPQSIPPRLLLLKTLQAIKKIRPRAFQDFEKPVQWLQKIAPLKNPYHSVIKTKLKNLFQKNP